MMRKLVLFICCMYSVIVSANRLHTISVTTNDQTFVSGDRILYSVFCFEVNSQKLAKNVQASFVELISSDFQHVFHHKVEMNGGVGQGDFLIPVGIPSGSYKLLGYTNSLKAEGVDSFFQYDIQIINPYELQTSLFEGGTLANDSFDTENTISEGPFEVTLSKMQATSREELQVVLKTKNRNRLKANFSVSIRKRMGVRDKTTMLHKQTIPSQGRTSLANANQLISGRIVDTRTNEPLANAEVILSIGGDNFVFDIESTNAEGAFSFSAVPITSRKTAIVQLLTAQPETYEIIVDPIQKIDYSKLQFTPFTIEQYSASAIESQAVYNQIESAYTTVKPDEVLPTVEAPSFVQYENKERYVLADYTYFPTMEDVILEYVDFVWAAKDKVTKRRILKAAPKGLTIPAKSKMLLFIDGVYQEDIEAFLASDSDVFKKVEVIRNKYQFANTEYEGVLLAFTKTNDYTIEEETNTLKLFQLDEIEPKKNYFKPNYTSTNSLETIPDYRAQLLWIPTATLDSNAWATSFSTSDVLGSYEVLVTGVTDSGQAFYNVVYLQIE